MSFLIGALVGALLTQAGILLGRTLERGRLALPKPKRCASFNERKASNSLIESLIGEETPSQRCIGVADPRCHGDNCTAHCQKHCGGACLKELT